MADNPVFEAGTARLPIGTTIAADDVGGALYQRVKIVWGADGTVNETNSLTATALPVFLTNAASIAAGSGGTQYAEDTAHTTGDTGNLMLAVRNDALAALTSTDGDYSGINVTAEGMVRITSRGSVAHDSPLGASSGSPNISGGHASAAAPADVSADGDAVRAWYLRNGSQVVNIAVGGQLVSTLSAFPVTVTSVPSHLVSVTGTVSVVVLSHPEVTLTGSFVNHAANALDVNIVGGAGSGGTASTDDAAFTVGVGSGTPAMGYAAADSVDAGDVGVLRMSTARGLHTNLVNAAGNVTSSVEVSEQGEGLGRLHVFTGYGGQGTQTSLSATNLTLQLNTIGNMANVIALQFTGTWAGDIFFEATTDGTNYVAIDAIPSTGNTRVSQVTGNGVWILETGGFTNYRARASLSSGVVTAFARMNAGGNVRQAAGSAAAGSGLVSVTGTVSVQITSMVVPVSLTGSFIDGVTNTITTSLTAASKLISITGTVSVQITSMPEVTLTGSYVDGISNALRGSLTAASRLFSLTGTASVQITSAVSLSVQITSTTVPFSLTGSFIDGTTNTITTSLTAASKLVSVTGTVSVQITSMVVPVSLTGSFVSANNALRVEGTLTFSVAITSAVPFSITGSFVNLANNALRVEGTLTFLAETRFAAPATSKLSRANFQFSTTASSTLVAGVGGQTIRLMKILFTTETAMTFQFESSTSAISSVMRMPTDGAMILDLDGEPWYITSTADPLRLHANNPASIGGTVWYTQS